MRWGRLNIPEIEAALERLGVASRDDLDPSRSEEALTPDTLRRLAEGYRYVDRLLEDRTEIFRYGQTHHILELNHRVLCGVTPERRKQFAAHITETERWFYDRPRAGIGAFFEWLQRNRTKPPRVIAAGIFVQVISTPQLFIEGNRRAATLLASYVLARSGLPPLVATAEVYLRYRQETERCNAIDRDRIASTFTTAMATVRVAEFLQETVEPRFLRERSQAPSDAQ